MLQQITVSNYALIEHVQLDWSSGLTAITGETGSGKSILIGALGLLLGERADLKTLDLRDKKCVVEAVFDVRKAGLSVFFQENDLDADDYTTVRREITASGKSRAFINDTPVSLQLLRELSSHLVDIHSQHENQLLGRPGFQFDVLDQVAAHQQVLTEYRSAFQEWKDLRDELESTIERERQLRLDADYMRFQLEELTRLPLEKLDSNKMEQELETLQNAEGIKQVLAKSSEMLDGDSGVSSSLILVKNNLSKFASVNGELDSFHKRLESLCVEVRDLSEELSSYADGVEFDEERIQNLTEQFNQLNQLLLKHRVETSQDLILLRESISGKLNTIDHLDERITNLKSRLAICEKSVEAHSIKLTKGRVKAATKLESDVLKYFSETGLLHAELKCKIESSDSYTLFGKNKIQFLFRANKGGSLLPVGQVASGGEMSRVMLALKSLVSKYKSLPVLILDEIDQGISGEVANKVGLLLKEMSDKMQVICITHLPQIAGKAQNHFKVLKEVRGNSTVTSVRNLKSDERVEELAEMLGGKNISTATRQSARELLGAG